MKHWALLQILLTRLINDDGCFVWFKYVAYRINLISAVPGELVTWKFRGCLLYIKINLFESCQFQGLITELPACILFFIFHSDTA